MGFGLGMWDRDELDVTADQYTKCEAVDGNYIILSQNIRSYRCNRKSLNSFLHRISNIKILCLQEIWKMGTENLVGFQLPYFRERVNRSGGGVAIFCASSVVAEEVSTPFICGVFESIGINTKINNKEYQIVSVYCPPKTNIITILNYLKIIKDNAADRKLVIMGDFNVDILKPELFSFNDDLDVLGVPNLIHNPTRITDKSSTAIDLIFTNDRQAEAGIIETDITDHLTTYISLFTKREALSHRLMPLHDFRSLNYLKDMLKCIKWESVTGCDTIEAFDIFESILHDARDICCPNEQKFNKKVKFNEPWFSRGLRVSRAHKERLFSKTRHKKGTQNWLKYIEYRRVYNNLCKKAKIEFYFSEFRIHRRNGKKIWETANEVVGRGKSRDEITCLEGCSNDRDVATKFNDFFSDIAPSLAKQINPMGRDFKEFLPNVKSPKMLFKCVTENQILKILSKMKNKVSFSHDFISNKLLRHVKEEIAKPLSHLVNLSLKLSHVPQSWKRAKVVPVFKSGSKLDPGNYRPISLLPTLSKVMEKVVHHQVINHLNSHKLLFEQQYGFRGGFSCEQLLIKLQNLIFNAKLKKKFAIMVFIDLKKAFDTTAHNILLHKIKHYGLPVDWFQSYLTGRGQYTNIKCENSDDKVIDIGVPQGSILGPLLFLLYINDMPFATSLISLLYADDTTYFYSHENLGVLVATVNDELKRLEAWFACNYLTLHPGKTRFILVGPGSEDIKVMLCGQEVQRVGEKYKEKCFKLVGVHLDENLNFKHHINKVHSKVAASLSLISRSKRHLPVKIKCMLYNALVESYLSYCITIWGAPSVHLRRLEILQKKTIRSITCSGYNCHTDPLFSRLGILKIKDLYELNLGKLGWGILNKKVPQQVTDCFTIRDRRTQISQSLYEPTCRTDNQRKFTAAALPRVWNDHFAEGGHTSKQILVNSFKNSKFHNYSSFICSKPNCYACNISNSKVTY